MSNIPKAREQLERLAARIEAGLPTAQDAAAELRRIIRAYLWREPAIRRARNQSERVTPEMAERIAAFVKANPDIPLAEIAHAFNINPGRVSEVLHDE